MTCSRDVSGRAERPAATFQERVDAANADLEQSGSKRRVGYQEGGLYPYFVAGLSGEWRFGSYQRLDDVLAAIATLNDNSLEER